VAASAGDTQGPPPPPPPDTAPNVRGPRAWITRLSPWGPPLKPGEFSKKRRRVPALAGLLAATTALLVALLMRFQGGGLFVPEAAVDFAVARIPGSFESAAISLMGGGAKAVALAVAIFGFLAAHAAFALYYPRLERFLGKRWMAIAAFSAAPAMATLLVVLPLFGKGLAGSEDASGVAGAVLSAAASSAAFGVVLDAAQREFARTHPEGIDLTRRTAIRAAAVVLIAAALGAVLLGGVVTRVGRLAFGSTAELKANEVTPNGSFYRVSKNVTDPAVDPSSWRLEVTGLVDRPLSLTSNELLGRSLREEVVTLECVSNEVGGNLIGNARWSGVPLSDLLGEAGVKPGASWAVFECADGYDVGVPLLRARGPGALLALYMNGERLPREHGFPARVLVPGLFGMMNAKWVRQVRLVDQAHAGYWQRKGWTNDGAIRLTAIIAVAPTSAVKGRSVEIGGVAFAGERRVARVEVSEDGGATWALADLERPLSPYAWTLWTHKWTPASEGIVRLEVRAVEESGASEIVQPRTRASPYPSGATGLDAVEVTVTA